MYKFSKDNVSISKLISRNGTYLSLFELKNHLNIYDKFFWPLSISK